jgi:hypothetical protein
MSITNYWAIIAGSSTDYVAGGSLTLPGTAALVADRFGNANGSFQVASTPATAAAAIYFPGASFSITFWLVSLGSSSMPIIDFGNGGNSDDIYFVINNPNVCSSYSTYFQLLQSSSQTFVCSSFTFSTSVWYHVALTYNLSSLSGYVYVNGVLKTSNLGGMGSVRNVTRSSNYFGRNCILDDIKFHSRILTAQEVLNDYVYNQSYINLV